MSEVIVSVEVLRDLATVGLVASSGKAAKPVLERVVFEVKDGSIKAYATDSYRLAEVTREVSSVEVNGVERFEINAKHLEGAVKAIGAKYRGDVVIEVADTTVTITGGGSTSAMYREDRSGNADYPTLANIWPSSFSGFDGAMRFNPKFLATLPKLAGLGDEVRVSANGADRPVQFESVDGATKYLLMPVRGN
jgi:DNA polymerase III sliding clamp (beta) subunit (PCNA family)